MTNLPSQHPTLSLHLTDHTLHPLITSSSSPSHLHSLTDLTSSALISQTAVQRAGLGRPQRIMVEYPDRGPVVLQSYLEPPSSAVTGDAALAESSTAGTTTDARGQAGRDNDEDGALRAEEPAPMLVGVVVAASADEAREARRAAGRLERIGREFQKEWAGDDAGAAVAADGDSSLATTD